MQNYQFYEEKLRQKTIVELRKMLEDGEISSEELVWAYLEHIAAEDTEGAELQSIREFNPDAFGIARERDWERRTGNLRGPLHGIPIMLKDCIDTADRMHTSCGSAALKNHYAENDAFLVKRLREAGAIILCKNNMSEFYCFNGNEPPNGYSGILGGSPKNPFDAGKLLPGGSSGGSAVAVAADFGPAAIGTDTAGSIFEPAAWNGIVGYKPTVGLISRTGLLPLLMCQDGPGPLTRSVTDTAILANVLIARDPEDPDTIRAEAFQDTDFTEGLEEASLEGKRIGIVRKGYYSRMSKGAVQILEETIQKMVRAGASVIEVENFYHAQSLENPEAFPMRTDKVTMDNSYKMRLDHYLCKMKDVPFRGLEGLLQWNREHPEAIPIGQGGLERVFYTERPLMNRDFIEARMRDLEISGSLGIWAALEDLGLDALILPGVEGQAIPAIAGNPFISVPAGYDPETGPVGLNLVGALMDDLQLLQIARACEKLLPPRPVPSL